MSQAWRIRKESGTAWSRTLAWPFTVHWPDALGSELQGDP